MKRNVGAETNIPRLLAGLSEIKTGSIAGIDPVTPKYVRMAQPGDQVVGIFMESIDPNNPYNVNDKRVAVDIFTDEWDEFEAEVVGDVASEDFENKTFDVSADSTDDPYSMKIDVSTPGTQFQYITTTQSDVSDQSKNVAVFRRAVKNIASAIS